MNHTSILPLFFISAFFLSCSPDEPTGSVPQGKTFSVAVPSVGQALGNSIDVSDNGKHIYILSNTNQMLYSSDGGATFNILSSFPTSDYIVTVNNDGAVLNSRGMIIANDGTDLSAGLPGSDFILGDYGKVFAWSHNYSDLQYRSTNENEFHQIEEPEFNSYPELKKVPGKGVAMIDPQSFPGASEAVTAIHIVDEQTLQITSYTINFDNGRINGCNNLNRFTRYDMQYDNKIIIRGCTGFVIYDLTTNNTKYVDYPDVDGAVYTDLRDNEIYMDDLGNIYLSWAQYSSSGYQQVYQYNGNEWAPLSDYISRSSMGSIYQVHHNLVFYNSSFINATTVAAMVKWDVATGTKTQMNLIFEPLNLGDAVMADDEAVLFIREGKLYKYLRSSGVMSQFTTLTNVTHINVLADGRWLAGGFDELWLSSDKGNSWSNEKLIFSQFSTTMIPTVNESRIVNGKILIVGTQAYSYYNQTTGMNVMKYDNIAIESSGAGWSQVDYRFPGDFKISCISPDGVVYGAVDFIDPFTYQTSSIGYTLRVGVEGEQGGDVPILVMDNGDHINLRQDTDVLEIQTRSGETGDWTSTGTKFSPTQGFYGGLKLTQVNGRFALVYHSEIYAL